MNWNVQKIFIVKPSSTEINDNLVNPKVEDNKVWKTVWNIIQQNLWKLWNYMNLNKSSRKSRLRKMLRLKCNCKEKQTWLSLITLNTRNQIMIISKKYLFVFQTNKNIKIKFGTQLNMLRRQKSMVLWKLENNLRAKQML